MWPCRSQLRKDRTLAGRPSVSHSISSRTGVWQDILQPCLSWSSSDHLAVDEIHKVPIFRKSLKTVGSHYGQAGLPYFEGLISNISRYTKQHSTSTCVIITRPPEIIACFCLSDVPAELFVIFDSHPRPDKHPHGAAFIFKNSVRSTAEYLTNLLHFDEHLLRDSTVQWQAQLLAHCLGDVFVARRSGPTTGQWGEMALEASLQVLKLQASVRSLERKNEDLEEDKKRLNQEVADLEDKLLELDDEHEKLKARYEQLQASTQHRRNTSAPRSSPSDHRQQPLHSPLGLVSSSTPTPRTLSTHRPPQNGSATPHASDLHAADALASQLQRAYNEENRQLAQQLRHLKEIQPTFFDCGICFERHQDDHLARVMPCGHSYCRPCLRAYAVSKINEHHFPIVCPSCVADRGRSEYGDDFAIQQLGLGERQYEIFSELQLARFSTIIHCRRCLKTIFVDKAEYEEAQEIAIQIGGPTHSCDGSSELKDLMAQRGWKHCPGKSGCQTPAEKIDGCNYMTCMSPGCNAHFCYLCGQLIVQSVLRNEIQSAVSRHYRRCVLF
ncbi:hypothetical protein BD311DRAFT_775091 [Dichomitus squalens]|uniref:RBR-type E3 ubiquitin transferase n=1 Tax=Dichomitus squalens TaxID=114155 RepID=A0A4V2K1I7_9APHY|nr:hypothetical protein BD311DRAFT_775091 [Dichomitus squalens]